MTTLETPERTIADVFDTTEQIEERLDRAAELSESSQLESDLVSPNACPRLGELRATWESPSQLVATVVTISFLGGLFSLYFLPMIVWIGVMAVAFAISFATIKLGGKDRAWHYQNGIRTERGKQESELAFDDLGTFSAEWTDTYTNGVYNGTGVRMKLFSQSDIDKTIQFEHSAQRGKSEYEELEELQSLMSARCAARMRARLDESGSVPWTSSLTLVTDGVVYSKSSKHEPIEIKFDQMSKFDLNNGKMKIWTDGWAAKISQDASAPNFFPGLLLFKLLGKDNRGI